MVVLFTLHWDSPQWQEDWLPLLSDIFSTALGSSAAFTIISEFIIIMVLLAPALYKSIKNKGKAEGKKAHQNRLKEAYKRFGFEVDGKLVLPRIPEVDAFLDGDDSTEE